ncbi:MAG TPA: glycosyltransferase N-terminal domain-containing protein [Bacteroidota bacterium]|nr:glycosyltransferase N-terminal domain-containing protein [Bacteroidota bacterium]
MKRLWSFIYNFGVIPLFWSVIQAIGIVDPKTRQGIRGRDALFADLARHTSTLDGGARIWFHSSSMGEFEQAKPIIAELRRRHPSIRVVVSFFSPSGYEHSLRYRQADVITYLPFDTRANARRFLDLVRPDAAVMVRYDIWPNHIWQLQERGIPVMIANATMRARTKRRLPLVRSFHHYVYNAIDEILTVADSDMRAFRHFRLDHPVIQAIGDTRYDQVQIRCTEARQRRIMADGVTAGKRVVVIGSSWPEDEEVVLPACFDLLDSMDDLLVIVVPHEPTEDHLASLERDCAGRSSVIRFSALNEYAGERVVIVDSVGILMVLYASADIAYVGGSFRQGIHNVLEAAVYGIPVVFGPKHRNSHEPLMLLESGGGFAVNDSSEFRRTLEHLLEDSRARKDTGERAAQFVHSHVGATGRFLEHLERHLNDPRGGRS